MAREPMRRGRYREHHHRGRGREHHPRSRRGTASPAAAGRSRSTSGTSSSATTPRTPATRLPGRPDRRTTALWKRLTAMFRQERERGVYDVDAHTPSTITAHAPGYIDRDSELIVGLQTDAPLSARSCPTAAGAWSRTASSLRLRARPAGQGDLHQLPQDPQRRRLRRLHRRDPRRPPVAHHHRPAGRLRPRPDHRRLPPGRAVRRRPPDRGQAGRARPHSTPAVAPSRTSSATARSSPSRSARWASSRRWPPSYGYDISGPADDRPRGHPVALLRLPGRGQGAERRGDVAGPHLDLPRHLPRSATSTTAGSTETRGAGADRRLRHQAADRPVPAHPGVRRAVLRRPDLGDRVDRRHRRGRPPAGHPDLVPLPADPLQPGPGARAEPDRALVAAAAGRASRSSARRCRSTPARSSTSPTS